MVLANGFFKIVDGIGRALSFIPHPFAQAGSLAAKGIVMMRPTQKPKVKTMRIAANRPAPPPMPVRLQNRPMARNPNPPKPPPMQRKTKDSAKRRRQMEEEREWQRYQRTLPSAPRRR